MHNQHRKAKEGQIDEELMVINRVIIIMQEIYYKDAN